ncbi:unnamed protein product, partial [Mesorhabditis belari]|uniref:glucuronosyltransferase n=1 Tax=Mesorhabditis belari TaxID=2138241 RepID=A0AAF3FM69_9BILA
MNLEVYSGILIDEPLMQRLRDFRFDIAFTQPHEWGGYALFYELGITKYITVASSTIGSGYSHLIGAPLTPSYVPAMHSRHGDVMNVFERFENFLVTAEERYLYCSEFEEMDTFMTRKYPEYPGSKEMAGRSSYLFTNSDPLMDFPRPLLEKIVFIGGITMPPMGTMRLDENLIQVLEKRKFNVLISFGSMSKSVDMPEKYKRPLIEAMKRLPEVTFLWKYENEDDWIKEMPENVHREKWFPQLALLEDDRLTGFMTHTGAGSLNELTTRGKKAICVPLFADQFTYARQLERLGVAIYLSKSDLTDEEKILNAFKRLITDENFRMSENAKKYARIGIWSSHHP